MKLTPIAPNMTEIETAKATVLFSYSTPVACCMQNGSDFFRTDHKWSVTTTRHINKWLDGAKAKSKPQAFFDNLL